VRRVCRRAPPVARSRNISPLGQPRPIGFRELAKTLHTERHRKLRELLVARRKAAGLTQTVLAQRLGKPPSYVAKYELGERRLDVLEFLDIAAAIGFDPGKVLRLLAERAGPPSW
jgi:ribosome-binding protein aMBF1 (putative translation factor)